MGSVTLRWSVGLAVLTARRAAGMTQEELGDELATRTGRQWSQSAVSRLERGVRIPDVVDLIALRDLFGLGFDYWIDGAGLGTVQATLAKLRRTLQEAA